jgi:hypothetical protein
MKAGNVILILFLWLHAKTGKQNRMQVKPRLKIDAIEDISPGGATENSEGHEPLVSVRVHDKP